MKDITKITYWIQKPTFRIGVNKWKETPLTGNRDALTIFIVFIGLTFYW